MAKTTDELFAEATEADYETAEPVTLAASDTEEEFQFRIDEHLRTIAIPEKGVVAGVEGDLNVNIARFTMTRYYHGRDLSKLNIRINYRNANGQVNYYTVSDATISGDSIVFSWEYAADVTQYKGNVQFVVYLFSATSAVLKQRFFTTLGTLEVLEGLEVDSSIPVSEQTDILLHLKKDLSAYAEEVKKSLPADYTAMTEQVSSLKSDLSEQVAGLKKEIDEKGVTDGSITEEKLSDELAAKVNRAGYVVGADGKKYSIAIDINGNISANRIYEISTDGLLCDIQIMDGTVVDTTGNVDTSGFAITDDYFSGDAALYNSAGTNLVENAPITGNRTVILLGDFSNATNLLFCNDDTMYGIRKRGRNPYYYFDDFTKQISPMTYFTTDKDFTRIYSKAKLTSLILSTF